MCACVDESNESMGACEPSSDKQMASEDVEITTDKGDGVDDDNVRKVSWKDAHMPLLTMEDDNYYQSMASIAEAFFRGRVEGIKVFEEKRKADQCHTAN